MNTLTFDKELNSWQESQKQEKNKIVNRITAKTFEELFSLSEKEKKDIVCFLSDDERKDVVAHHQFSIYEIPAYSENLKLSSPSKKKVDIGTIRVTFSLIWKNGYLLLANLDYLYEETKIMKKEDCFSLYEKTCRSLAYAIYDHEFIMGRQEKIVKNYSSCVDIFINSVICQKEMLQLKKK